MNVNSVFSGSNFVHGHTALLLFTLVFCHCLQGAKIFENENNVFIMKIDCVMHENAMDLEEGENQALPKICCNLERA